MHSLINNLTAYGYPSERITENVLPCFQPFAAHETSMLLREDELVDKLCFMCEGVTRTYVRVEEKREKGRRRKLVEVNRSVAKAGEWFTVPHAFLRQAVSEVNIEFMGPGRGYYILYEDYKRLVATDADFRNVVDLIWAGLFEQGFAREDLMRIYPSEKRFKLLEATYGDSRTNFPNMRAWASLAGASESSLKRYLEKQSLNPLA